MKFSDSTAETRELERIYWLDNSREPKPQMQMVPVDSSHLKAVGYDPRSQKMRVQFKNNVTYEYQGITPELHHAVTNWTSSGSAFANLIKSRFKGKIVG